MNTILITGAASGIGAATARLFHRRGWQVGLLDISAEPLARLSGELGGAWHATLDVSDADAVQGTISAFAAAHDGQLRVIFNCAGLLHFGPFEGVTAAEHGRLVAVNVQGVINCCSAAFPYLKATPGAQVINMGSASGLYGVPQMATYSATKFAVRGLTEALELEWLRHGIRVADLMPPFVATPMVKSQALTPPILRRLGVRLAADDIAAAVWAQTTDRAVHRPIGLLYKLIYWAGQISPPAVDRWTMRWLSRE